MRDLSISVYFARAVLKNAVAQGLDPISLLRKNRISPRLMLEESARISIERFADLQVSTMRAMNDETLGYGAQRMPIGCWSMMCHAVIGCETLGQALSRYCRFYQLFDIAAQPVLEEDGDLARITLAAPDTGSAQTPYLHEMLLFNTHRFASWLVQEHLPLQAVNLSYAPLAPAMDYRHMFLANPIEFEHPLSQLVISRSLLDKRVTQNETSLRHFLRHLRDMPELSAVATALEVHPQTLRRRLSAEGTTFKDIKNQVRRDTALHFLGKQGLSIEEIAHRAGFSESSAFIRAFKGWTGVTPYTYRKGL